MPIFTLIRSFFALVSLAVLAAAAYFLWRWYQGDLLRDANGLLFRRREDWQLWLGGVLLAWSVAGRLVARFLLARSDTDPMLAKRGQGRTILSETGATLYLEEHGSPLAPALILTHGWSMDSTIWHYAKRDLAREHRVIVWDLPGLGLSKRAGGEVCLSGFARDLKSVVAQVGDQRPILVGHSIGGMIIETLARDDPDWFHKKVSGVALLNTSFTDPLKTMVLSRLLQAIRKPVIVPMLMLEIWLAPLAWLMSWQSYLSGSTHISARFGFGRFVTRSQLDHVALLMTRAWPAVTARGDLAMLRWDGSAGVAQLSMPVLIVGGSADIVTKPSASATIADLAPNATLQIAEGANHMGPVERAELYNGAVGDLARHVQSKGSQPSHLPASVT